MMKIQRILSPTAPPIHLKNLLYGLLGFFFSKKFIKKVKGEFQDYFGVKHVFLVSSGKAALALILNALESLDPRREVLIPAYTCFSVPSAIIKAGLKVSLCDIEPETFDFNYDLLEKAINKDTLCVIPCNLFGIPSELDRIKKLCREKGIFIIEDAAQAMGGTYKGRKIGTIGDVGFFSLGRGKNITCGSGGIIVTNSDQIADIMSEQYSHLNYPTISEDLKELFQLILMAIFIHPLLYWLPASMPFLKLGETIFYREFPIKKFSGMKAGLLKDWKNQLVESNKVRKNNTAYFDQNTNSTLPCLRFPVILEDREKRDRIHLCSRKQGLGISKMYPTPINEVEEIEELFNGMDYPVASMVTERLITVPTHQRLSEKDKEDIYRLLNDIS